MSDTPSSIRRSVVWLVCLTVVTVAVAAVWITIGRPKTVAPADPLAGFKPVAVTSGTLSTSESVNGTVELNQVTQVLHRIEGQTSVATTGAPAASTGSTPARGSTGSTGTSGSTGSAAQTATATSTAASAPAAFASASGFAPPGGASAGCGPTTTSTSTTSTSSTSSTSTSSTSSTSTTSTILGSSTSSSTTTTTICATTTTVSGAPRTSTPGGTGTNGAGGAGGAGGASKAGSSGSGGSSGSAARVTQVVTSVISVGAPVTLGTVLYAVESKPVVALSGALPAWRTLKVGVADGPDVQQLELSLVALGYDRSNTMKVDQHFDSNTKAAVQRWQAGYGLTVTGSVTLGSIVFLPTASTVSAVQTKVGASLGEGDKVLSLAAANQDVVINVPTGDEAFVVPGFAVKIGNVDGTVSLLRSATQNGATVVEAVVTPAAPITGAANGATARVTIQHDGLTGVLLAPAAALASRLDGSYAVQVVAASGAISWVPVEVLATANGNVAIRGTGITEGTKVLQPR